jgi:outer membrane beta-barrel protein
MRRSSPLALVVLAICLPLTQPLAAQGSPKLDITAFAGAAIFPGTLADELLVCEGIVCDRIQDVGMKTGVAFGAHAGARFGAWSVEGTLAYAPSSFEGTSTLGQNVSVNTNLLLYGVDALYTFPSENPLMEFFVAGGVGAKTHSPSDGESQTNLSGNLGVGLRVWLSPTMALRFEGRDYISSYEGLASSSLQNDILFTVGVSFSPAG